MNKIKKVSHTFTLDIEASEKLTYLSEKLLIKKSTLLNIIILKLETKDLNKIIKMN